MAAFVAATGTIISLCAAAPASAECHLNQLAELDATVRDDMPLVPATIDNQSVQMIFDTAFTRTQMSRTAAKELHLPLHPSIVAIHGPDGDDVADMTNIHDFTFAGWTAHRMPLYVTGQVPATGNAAGAIGEDILSHFDIEFDLSSRKIRLFAPGDCRGDSVAYWTRAYYVTDLAHSTESGLPLVEVTLNGQKVLAAFSSGLPQSTVTTKALQLSGINPDSSVVVVPTLTIGQETLRNEKLKIVAPDSRYGMARAESQLDHRAFVAPDVEIGGDFFLTHRIYWSRGQKKIYFTYNGPTSRTAAQTTSPARSSGGAAD